MSLDLILRGANLPDGRSGVDIGIADGKIAVVQPELQAEAREERDVSGRLVTPPFVDAHFHMDSTLTLGQPRLNRSGTLLEGIALWGELKPQLTQEAIMERALAYCDLAVARGMGAIRSHVDVCDDRLLAVEALLEVKRRVAPYLTLQLVAFPQDGFLRSPTAEANLLRALDMGVEVVGGIPHLEPTREDGVAALGRVFDLAERYGVLVDVHCDEIDDAHSRFVEVMAAETQRRSLQGRVTVSHAVAMAYYGPGYLSRLLPKLVAAQLGFAVNPNENLHLQGRGFGAPTPRGVAPVRTLTEWGLPVAFGQDSMADPWYPLGVGDLLRVLDSGLHVAHLLTPEYLARALDFITDNPARNLALDDYGIAEGRPASLLVLDAPDDETAVREKAEILLSVHRGREVFRREPARTTWAL